MRTLRFIIFNVVCWGTCIIWGTACLIAALFGSNYAYAVAKNWAALVLVLVRLICGLRYKVRGIENFPKETCVVLIKHSSAFETFTQLVLYPRNCWVLKRELLWVPFFGWTLKPLKAIAIDRSDGRSAVKQVVEQGKKRLAEGINVSMFPEGTRMPAGTTKRYGISGTLLAQEAGCLIVPVAHDAGYFWPRRGLGIVPGEITVVVGKPVDPAGRDPRDVNIEIQNWVEGTIRELVDNAKRN